MQTKLKLSATILLVEDDYINLKRTIDSIQNEVDNIFVLSPKNIQHHDLKFELILNNNFNGDFANYRNLIKNNLPNHILFHLNCGETLETKDLKDYLEEKNYRINILYDQFVLKEVRITQKKDFKFSNKVYEYIDCNNYIDSIIKVNASQTTKINLDNYLNEWSKKEPLNYQVDYYKTLNNLYSNNYKQFIIDAEKLIFKNSLKEENELLLRYYLVNIFVFKIKNDQKAIENILTLLAKRPDMPEFWCLIGDYWYMKNNFKNAKCFYKYAILSSKHKNYDADIFTITEKHNTYPNKMILNCDKIIQNQATYLK